MSDQTSTAVAGNPRIRSWVDTYYSASPFPFIVTAVLTGCGVYATGLAIALTYGFATVYARTLGVYLGCFGISWVTACVRWGYLKLPDLMMEMKSCFVISDAHYRRMVSEWAERVGSGRGMTILSLVLFIPLFLSVLAC